ncbi:MAG: hypothetical protein BSOLF_1259 [Candidatus Carbobacillus altaicus]|uniref:Uncharacterized protein n=1 Tax=Candidatus Carbonibacillus altaicus TaxID=2163959 RepID=A0A2R6Y4I3_9BACL|nr:MAG: hypothetical protein BSOLF_1259 [Candidatus Carbobacillus altaicus]
MFILDKYSRFLKAIIEVLVEVLIEAIIERDVIVWRYSRSIEMND